MGALEEARDHREAFSVYLRPEFEADIPIVRYRTLLAVRKREDVLRVIRAAALSTLAFSTALFGFLLHARPEHAGFWFQVALALGLISLLAAPLVSSRLAFQRRRRLLLTRKLYTAGLRLDEAGDLVTDEAHYRVICEKC